MSEEEKQLLADLYNFINNLKEEDDTCITDSCRMGKYSNHTCNIPSGRTPNKVLTDSSCVYHFYAEEIDQHFYYYYDENGNMSYYCDGECIGGSYSEKYTYTELENGYTIKETNGGGWQEPGLECINSNGDIVNGTYCNL